MRQITLALAFVVAFSAAAQAQANFPTPGGSQVNGTLMLQVNPGTSQAQSCPGPTAAQDNYPTPGGATAKAKVKMCLNASNQAVPCATQC